MASISKYEIFIENLTYTHPGALEPSLNDITLRLPKGSRTILVGANGGAQTLYRLLFAIDVALLL